MELPEGIAALGPDTQKRVDDLVADARRRQQAELRDALQETLRLVPKPLRGLVRKAVGV